MTKGKKTFQPITSNDVFQAYQSLISEGLLGFPLTDSARNKIESLVSVVNSSYFGQEIYKTTEEKVVAYLYLLIKDHPFTDGNKRTAILVFKVACRLNDLVISHTDIQLDELAVFIEKIKDIGHQEAIRTLAVSIFDLK